MAAAAAIIGMGITAYSTIKSSEDQASAGEADAAVRNKQADEIGHAGRRQEEDARLQEGQVTSEQRTVFAKGGIDMSGSALLALEDTHYRASKEVTDIRHEWEFKQAQVRAGAKIQEDLASSTRTSGYIKAGGTILSDGARAYSVYGDKTGKPSQWSSAASNSTDARGFSNA